MSVKSKWLIKSDYKILGPYSFEQVEDLIMKRQISLIDEIRDMDLRWSYVREVPDFRPLVDKVREEIDKKSDMTQTVQTSTSQKTVSADPLGTITAFPRLDQNHEEILLESVADISAGLVQKEALRRKPMATLVEPPKKVSNFSLKAIVIAGMILVLGSAGAWFFMTYFGQSKNEKIIFQQIRKYNLYAQDDKSIDLFKKLPPESQDKIVTDLIPLWLKLEASGALSSTHMLDLMTKGKVVGNERKSQYQLVKFNKAFNLGDVQNAKEALIKAIDLDPTAVDVKENDAILSFSQKKYADSARLFKNLYDQSSEGRYLYGYVLSQIDAHSINGSAAFQLIEKHLNSRIDFKKELLFLQIYILKKILPPNSEQLRNYLSLFLDFPHQMAKYFRMSSLINRTSYNWEDLESLRLSIFDSLDHRDSILLNINFLLEKNEIIQAQDFYLKNQNILTESDRYNLDITFNYFKKTFQSSLQISTEGKRLALSSQLYLLMMYNESKTHHETMMQFINMLPKEIPLFSNWAMLLTAKLPEDKEQMKTLINGDRLYSNEFLPYLEFKAMASNE